MTEGSSEAGLWAMADLVTPMALRVAATLRVADHIAGGLDTAPELADAVQADTEALDRLLLHLVSVEVLTRDRSGRYALAPRGESLRDDHPSGTRALIDTESAIGRADLSFVHLLHSVRTGEAAFPLQFGRGFWEDLDSETGLRASYDEQMGADVAAWAPHILAAYDWGSLDHVVDVGGGNGTLLAALLSAHPRLRGTLFDQPRTAEAARRTLTAAGLDARSDVLSGSFFDRLPPGAGGYVLCAILHDWDDEAATLRGSVGHGRDRVRRREDRRRVTAHRHGPADARLLRRPGTRGGRAHLAGCGCRTAAIGRHSGGQCVGPRAPHVLNSRPNRGRRHAVWLLRGAQAAGPGGRRRRSRTVTGRS